MSAPSARSRRSVKPGLRALALCGDGFWEFDLIDGSAWYSDWFYQRLGWPLQSKRTALQDLRDAIEVEQWETFMAGFRAHLERAAPFDVRLQVTGADGRRQRWHLRGAAQRTDAGLPLHVAGNARELGADDLACAERSCRWVDALPNAVAILHAQGEVLYANARWLRLEPHAIAALIRDALGAKSKMIELRLPNESAISTSRARFVHLESAGAGRWLAIIDD